MLVSRLIRMPRALNLGALSILVIDDQPFFRVLLTEVLRSLGVGNVAIAVDGEDGFDAFQDIRPDVVITDWMMPKLDGIDLTRRIRNLSDEAQQKVPVILVTAKSERSQIDLARSSGIDEFILKPISAKAICDRLREVIERPRPFVTFESYTGPCRRRRDEPNYSGPFRRFTDPFEIEGSDDEVLAEGLRSVFLAASSRVEELTKGLVKSNVNIRPIHMAVSEMEEIAEDMGDKHLERLCELLLSCVSLMNTSGKSAPGLIQTHINAMAVLLRTPVSQTKTRDDVVTGLERMLKRPQAA
jgi:two-component system, chemotaxis family, chemotaxis protein CheY